MGQSTGSNVSVQTQDPWAGQQPYLRDLFALAQGMYTGRVGNYPQTGPGQTGPGSGGYGPILPEQLPGHVPTDTIIGDNGVYIDPTRPMSESTYTTDASGPTGRGPDIFTPEAPTPPMTFPTAQPSSQPKYDPFGNAATRAIDTFIPPKTDIVGMDSPYFKATAPSTQMPTSRPGGPRPGDMIGGSRPGIDISGGGTGGGMGTAQLPTTVPSVTTVQPPVISSQLPAPSGPIREYPLGGAPSYIGPSTAPMNTQNTTGASDIPSNLPPYGGAMPYAEWAGQQGINIPTPSFNLAPDVNQYQNKYMNLASTAGADMAPFAGMGANALASNMNPYENPFNQAAMSTLGSQSGALNAVLGGGMAPGMANTPMINFQAQNPLSGNYMQGTNTPTPYASLSQMMSGTPNMNIWGPLMDRAAQAPIRAFNEQVMPALRAESISAGAYGGPKHQQAQGLAAGRLGEQIMAGQQGIAKEAAMAALNQQQAGTGLASQLTQAGDVNRLNALIQGGQLNLGAQQLGGDLAKSQALLGLQAQQGNQNAWNQYVQNLNQASGISGNIGNQAYQTGLSGANTAASLMPQAMQSLLAPANVQGQLGDYRQMLDQQQIDAQMKKFNLPYDMLGRYAGMITGNYGGTTSTPVTPKSPFAAALGGAALGGSIGGFFPGFAPVGAGIGAGAGLLGLL